MSVQRGVKRVAASIAMEAVLEAIRGYLEELLKPVTPEQLYRAIKQGVVPWERAPLKVKQGGRTWTRNMRKYKDRLTHKLVLEWLHEDRPDLHNLIVNMGPEGTRWLAKMTEDVKQHLWPPEEGLKKVQGPPEEEEDPVEPESVPRGTDAPKVRWG